MRFTKAIRERIMHSILADIPKRDFKSEAETIVLPAAIERLPEKVRAVYEDKKTRQYLRFARLDTNSGALAVQVPCVQYYIACGAQSEIIGDNAWAAFQDLCGQQRAANEARIALARQIWANLSDVSNRKQFVERFPELAKHAPE